MNEAQETKPEDVNDEGMKDGEQILSRGTRSLPCDLTEEEQDEHSQELAKLTEEVAAMEELHKRQRADMKAAKDALVAKTRAEALIVKDREEYRDVECIFVGEADGGVLWRVRQDTLTRHPERALHDHEVNRLLSIPLPLKRKPNDPKKL